MIGPGQQAEAKPQAAPTTADFDSWLFIHDAIHFNGGQEFFGYGHRCINQPRILVIDKYFKKDRSTQRSFLVDGKTSCTTLDQALRALATPPVLSGEETALLRSLPQTDWLRPERRGPLLPLADMGMIEWGRDADNKVTCRLTPAARQHLASIPQAEPSP